MELKSGLPSTQEQAIGPDLDLDESNTNSHVLIM